jgi:hypothetical protein
MRTVDLAKQALTAIATAFVISGTIVDVNAASTLKMTCGGNLERVRHTGANGDTEDYPAGEVQELAQLVASEVAASVWSVEDEKEADKLTLRRYSISGDDDVIE